MKNTLLLISLITYVAINGQVTDVNGKKYKTGKFGTQNWTLENLDVSKFKNGDIIREVKTVEEWDNATKNQEPVWCYYENRTIQNDPSNGAIYGKLYNWYAINDPRGLAPKGWHIPSLDEWTILINFVGGIENAAYQLKSIDSWEPYQQWDYDNKKTVTIKSNTGGINQLGFNALPSGQMHSLISFNSSKGIQGAWWTTSINYSVPGGNYYDFNVEKDGVIYSRFSFDKCEKDQVNVVMMYNRSDAIEIYSECKTDGYSVRCIKD
jgi:uncharacterized protein (TIGR02145 family)